MVLIAFYILGNIIFAIGQKVIVQNMDDEIESILTARGSTPEQIPTELTEEQTGNSPDNTLPDNAPALAGQV